MVFRSWYLLRGPDHRNIRKISVAKCKNTHQYDENVIGMYEYGQSMSWICVAHQQSWQKSHSQNTQYGDDMRFVIWLKIIGIIRIASIKQ